MHDHFNEYDFEITRVEWAPCACTDHTSPEQRVSQWTTPTVPNVGAAHVHDDENKAHDAR